MKDHEMTMEEGIERLRKRLGKDPTIGEILQDIVELEVNK